MEANELSGVLLLDKPAGCTSHDLVNKVRRLYHTKRVGHTGTLDPMATGLLVVLVGRAAKAAEYLVAGKKKYEALLRLGISTDTEDTTGQVLATSDKIPTKEEVAAILPRFQGKIEQIPPMYSALKVGGQKLVDLARKGQTVERKPRPVEVYSLALEPTENPAEYKLLAIVSAGTYIRTLCADIGNALGCGGAMASLRRLETGGFSVADAKTVEEIDPMDDEERALLLLPTESLFESLPTISLSAFHEHLIRAGQAVALQKLGEIARALPIGARARLADESGAFFALGEVMLSPDGAPALKAIKTFVL